MKQCLPLLLLVHLACASPKPADPDIWRPVPGADSSKGIPGPLKSLGSFASFSDALNAACPLILSKPNATVFHLLDKDPKLALRLSTEYCAWIYYTPADRYELSMLTDMADPGAKLAGKASCLLPPNVDDPRYAPSSIKYIFLVHNHSFSGELSDEDIFLAVAMANAHELVTEARATKIPISVVAFYSKSKDAANPSCDGFFQYIPATNEVITWARVNGTWRDFKTGKVVWSNPPHFTIVPQ
jgi:hypothetical protein